MGFLVVSLICSSIMIPGFISYGVLTALERKRENLAVFLFTAVMLGVGISRTAALLIAHLRPDLAAAYRWNMAYEGSLLFFFPMIPFFLSSILDLGPKGKKLNGAMFAAGCVLTLAFLSVILLSPGTYMKPYSLGELPHLAVMGRGPFRPVSYVSMGLLFLYTVYTLVLPLSMWRAKDRRPHMTILLAGLVVSIFLLIGEFYQVFTGYYPGPFSTYSYPRALLGLSVFTLTVVVSMSQKLAEEARESARDRAEVRKKNDALAMVAYFDDMTGYANRSALIRDLQEKCEPPAHVALIDIDGLSYVNSYHGYAVGDALIRSVGKICEGIKPPDAAIYRVDADSFALLHRIGVIEMEQIAAEILRKVRGLAVPGAEGMKFTVSIGIAGAEPGIGPEEWANRVNTAMQRAKTGRDRFVTFDPKLHEDVKRRQEIITGMRRSLDESGFRMYYQPILSHDLRTVGAEALVRWDHPELGPISPEEFIPLAEASGLITRLTRFVVGKSIADFRDEGFTALGLRVNVNLSGKDVTDRYLMEKLDEILDDRNADRSLLGFEVTETDLIADTGQSIRNLNALRDAGYSVALDDFGTGYSSLSYLNDLPMDKLKIDRSFIADLPDNPRRSILLDAIIRLGRQLNLDLVLEGVENERQFEFLKSKDCRYFQGFHFAPPMALGDFRKWMAEKSCASA